MHFLLLHCRHLAASRFVLRVQEGGLVTDPRLDEHLHPSAGQLRPDRRHEGGTPLTCVTYYRVKLAIKYLIFTKFCKKVTL